MKQLGRETSSLEAELKRQEVTAQEAEVVILLLVFYIIIIITIIIMIIIVIYIYIYFVFFFFGGGGVGFGALVMLYQGSTQAPCRRDVKLRADGKDCKRSCSSSSSLAEACFHSPVAGCGAGYTHALN